MLLYQEYWTENGKSITMNLNVCRVQQQIFNIVDWFGFGKLLLVFGLIVYLDQ